MLSREAILNVSSLAGIGAVLCVLSDVYTSRHKEKDSAAAGEPGATVSRFYPHALWLIVVLKLAITLQAVMAGYVTQWPDDGCRFVMTTDSIHAFRLGPPDHIWPGGPFMLGSLLMRVTDDPVSAVRWIAVAFSVASVLATAWLTRAASGSEASGLAAGLLVAVLPMHTWLAVGTMTEVPMACLVTLSIACAVVGWRRLSGGQRGGGVLLLLSGLSATAAAAYRYEGWMFIAALGAVAWCHGGMAWLRRKEHAVPAHYLSWLIGATVLALSFPIAWSLDSWRVNGDPMAFFRNQTAMNTVGISEPLRDRLMLFPIGMNNQIKPLWGLVFAGLVCAIIRYRQRPGQTFMAIAVLAYFGIVVTVVAVKGMGVSLERYVISLIVLAAPFAGIAVGEAFAAACRLGKRFSPLTFLASGACALTLSLFTIASAREITHYRWFGYQNEAFLAGSLLQQEFHEPQLLPGLARGGRVMIWQAKEGAGLGHHWHIPLMAGNYPARTYFHEGAAPPPEALSEPNLTILRFNGGEQTDPPGFEKVLQAGTLTVYHRAPDAE